MADISQSGTGTAPKQDPKAIHSSRTTLYGVREHKALINRDQFLVVEQQARDRHRFFQVAAAAFGVGVTLVLDRALDLHLGLNKKHAITVMLFSVPFFIFGGIFIALYREKNKDYNTNKGSLFDKTNVVSDKTTTVTEDGEVIIINHLKEGTNE